VLGVERDNVAAIRACEKAGFRIGETPHLEPQSGVYPMIWHLGDHVAEVRSKPA
jgi:hypothetical protein